MGWPVRSLRKDRGFGGQPAASPSQRHAAVPLPALLAEQLSVGDRHTGYVLRDIDVSAHPALVAEENRLLNSRRNFTAQSR
jgi:hypothetical protein